LNKLLKISPNEKISDENAHLDTDSLNSSGAEKLSDGYFTKLGKSLS
jgi:hypothetical protein